MTEKRGFNFIVLVPVIIFAGILAAAAWGLWERRQAQLEGRDPNALPLAMQGQAAPALTLQEMPVRAMFTGEDLSGDGIKLVNFWASWCTPCRVEHPVLTDLAAQGLPLYGVNYKDDPADAAAFLNELGDPYTGIGADPSGRNGINWGVIAMPETFIIDGDGRILLRHAGPITSRVLETIIDPALAAAGYSR